MTSKLPPSFQHHAETTKGMLFCGQPIESFDKEDLLVIIGFIKKDFDTKLERQAKDQAMIDFLNSHRPGECIGTP